MSNDVIAIELQTDRLYLLISNSNLAIGYCTSMLPLAQMGRVPW